MYPVKNNLGFRLSLPQANIQPARPLAFCLGRATLAKTGNHDRQIGSEIEYQISGQYWGAGLPSVHASYASSLFCLIILLTGKTCRYLPDYRPNVAGIPA